MSFLRKEEYLSVRPISSSFNPIDSLKRNILYSNVMYNVLFALPDLWSVAGFTMYTTCVIWLAFVPLYFGTGNHMPLRITSMSVTISLSASVTIACLFSPKVNIQFYSLYFILYYLCCTETVWIHNNFYWLLHYSSALQCIVFYFHF